MADLLVSVRDAAEASDAVAAGATIVDIKEPNAGSLGAATPAVWRAVSQVVHPQSRISVALGELRDADLPRRVARLPEIGFAKIGLAACADDPKWPRRWQEALAALPRTTRAVAVAYADWQTALAPHPEEIVHCAAEFACHTLLVDTHAKHRGWLMDHLSARDLAALIAQARDCKMKIALAGSIGRQHVPAVLALEPDLLAVRGAVCVAGRRGCVDRALVRSLVQAIRGVRCNGS